MKLFRYFLYTFLSLFILLNILLAFHAYRFTYFYDNPERQRPKKPEEYTSAERLQGALFGLKFKKAVVDSFPTVPFQTVQLKTTDGETLEGWYVPAQAALGTVILSHGHANSKARVLAEAQYFHELGFNTLAYDFRAHGNSSGNICTIGYNEVQDIKAAYDFVARKGEKNIVLWGISMGAAAITKALVDYSDLKPTRVILECPFASLYEAVQGRLRTMHLPTSPASELLLTWGSLERGMWSFGYSPADYAHQLHMPVLLNWGANDKRVTRHETDEIFANIGSTRKQLIVFEQSGHQSFCKSEGPKWKAAINRFLDAEPRPIAHLVQSEALTP